MPPHVRAILSAQWRTLRNFYPRHRGGVLFSALISVIWYGGWTVGSFAIASILSEWKLVARLPQIMTGGLLVVFLYWQVTPLLLATTGASLDLKRLLVYPIPRGQLFAIEVMLRLSVSIEVLLLMCGATVGLLRNHAMPLWAPLAFIPFTLFNLFLSAGLRDLLTRLLARKRIREIVVFLLVMLAAVPQYLAMRGAPSQFKTHGRVEAIDRAAMGCCRGNRGWPDFVGLSFRCCSAGLLWPGRSGAGNLIGDCVLMRMRRARQIVRPPRRAHSPIAYSVCPRKFLEIRLRR